MRIRITFACLPVALFCSVLRGQQSDEWVAVKNAHFEVYSQKGGDSPDRALAWMERLRTVFLTQNFLPRIYPLTDLPVIRVIGFRSAAEYAEYRIRPAADAFYAQNNQRSYIVLPSLETRELSLATHEYAHFFLHAGRLKLPPWLEEGLADYCSTLQFTESGYLFGGEYRGRMQTLGRQSGTPLPELLEFHSTPAIRADVDRFYAQSWALVDMLIGSPEYRGRFPRLLSSLNSRETVGSSGAQAFLQIYGKTLDSVAQDLAAWIGRQHPATAVALQFAGPGMSARRIVPSEQADAVLADLLVAMGDLDRARTRFNGLAARLPRDPELHAALGTIAFRQHQRDEAIRQWREALHNGLRDADLCLQYAEAAEDAGASQPDVRAALLRAIEIRPRFDEARFRLGLLESNASNYNAVIEQLQAMAVPHGSRAYGYWATLAYAFEELGRRNEAEAAAQNALREAATADERDRARQIAYLARTDLRTQFITGPDGRPALSTTRVETGAPDFNPFIEPSDHMQRSEGQLSEVLCEAGVLKGFRVRTRNALLTVTVPDPQHVLIENGPHEFLCGKTVDRMSVRVDYAVSGSATGQSNILRGMSFDGAVNNVRP